MQFKHFWLQNSGHVSGAHKQNDRDHEISRHGSDRQPPWCNILTFESQNVSVGTTGSTVGDHMNIQSPASYFIVQMWILISIYPV
jgi:hypothetical protein